MKTGRQLNSGGKNWDTMNNNDLFLLYLLLLIFSLSSLTHKEYISDYIACKTKLGLNDGTLLLLSHLLKGFMIFILFQYMSSSNLLWGIVFSFSLFPMTYLFEKWIRSHILVHLNTPNHTPMTFFKERSTPYAYRCLLCIMASIAFFSFLAEMTWMSMMAADLFQIPSRLILFALIYLAYVYAVIGGFPAIAKVSRLLIVFTFGAVACLLLYFYLTNGVKTIYQNWIIHMGRFEYSSFSDISSQGIWLIMIICIYYGYLLTNLSLWHVNFSLKENRIKGIYRIATFCFAGLIIALILIEIFVQSILFQENLPINEMVHLLSRYSYFFTLMLIASSLSVGLMSSMVSLKSIMDAFLLSLSEQRNYGVSFFKNIYLVTLALLLMLCMIIEPTYPTLMLSIQLFALLCVVTIPGFSLIIFSAQKITLIKMLPTFIGFLMGIILLLYHFSFLSSLFWGLVTSLCLQILILCVKYPDIKNRIL